MVDFCDDCGSIIMGKKGEDSTCPACGKIQKSKTSISLNEKIKKTEDIEVIDKNASEKVNSIVDDKCKKCSETKVYFWTKQMRSGDEPETQFFKCTKCGHQWRDYS